MSVESETSRRTFLAGTIGTALTLSTANAAQLKSAHFLPSGNAQAPENTQAETPHNVNGPSAATSAKGPILTQSDIAAMMSELSNWGRWGRDDEMGTVNLITPSKRKHAVSLVREGLSISLSHNLDAEKALDNTSPLIHTMNIAGVNGRGPETFVFDTYTMNYHGRFDTHMDALCHCFWDHKSYNGFPSTIVNSLGAAKLDITAFKNGILTRGVLMDIPRLKGLPYLEPGTIIYPEDLDAWEKHANVKVSSGDMLLIRTGRWACRAEKGPWPIARSAAGLYAPCARWLKERDVAVLGSDAASDVTPSRIEGVIDPIHALVLAALGTPIFDNLDLEAASETSNRLRRWQFMVSAAPMVIPGGTGSPINPVATF